MKKAVAKITCYPDDRAEFDIDCGDLTDVDMSLLASALATMYMRSCKVMGFSYREAAKKMALIAKEMEEEERNEKEIDPSRLT